MVAPLRPIDATHELAGVGPGRRILELGCGSGEDAIVMARLVLPDGEVLVVDADATAVGAARHRAGGLGLPLRFEVADGLILPLADRSVDGCRAGRVLQHAEDPEAVLAELVRVTRPGGAVVATELLSHPRTDRRMPGLFVQAGLTGIQMRLQIRPGGISFLIVAGRKPGGAGHPEEPERR